MRPPIEAHVPEGEQVGRHFFFSNLAIMNLLNAVVEKVVLRARSPQASDLARQFKKVLRFVGTFQRTLQFGLWSI
jgi:hypothetical protein